MGREIKLNTTPRKNPGKIVGVKIKENIEITFSFMYFSRENKLFNLGDKTQEFNTVHGPWFISLIDCLKEASGKTIPEMCTFFDLHQVNWKSANVPKPKEADQFEYYQFRVSKSKGRVIGTINDGVFYIVWLDPHHNLTNSPHYPHARRQPTPMSEYDCLKIAYNELEERYNKLEDDYIKSIEAIATN